jgi:hypothetical protein
VQRTTFSDHETITVEIEEVIVHVRAGDEANLEIAVDPGLELDLGFCAHPADIDGPRSFRIPEHGGVSACGWQVTAKGEGLITGDRLDLQMTAVCVDRALGEVTIDDRFTLVKRSGAAGQRGSDGSA